MRSCASCSDTLATLRDTMTTLRDPAPVLVAPPASVWDAVEAELDREPDTTARPVATAEPVLPASAVATGDELADRRAGPQRAATVPARLGRGCGRRRAGHRRGRHPGRRRRPGAHPPWSPSRRTSLDTLDTQQVKGTADVVRHDGRLDLTVSTQPIDPDGGYLEVWLINKDLKRMVSVGVLEPSESDQSFAIPQELLDQGYVIVDISREGFDEAPEHSGDSVVRGTLAT